MSIGNKRRMQRKVTVCDHRLSATPRVISGHRKLPVQQQKPLLVREPEGGCAHALSPVLLRGWRLQVRNLGPVPADPLPPGRDGGGFEGVPLVGPPAIRCAYGAPVLRDFGEERQ